MLDLLRRWLFALTTGFALVFFSELFFWGAPSFIGFVETWFYYSFVVYLFLMIVAYFRVNSIWSVLLAGAIYGWLVEGVIVQTTYENLPISISDTALSWHALISVGFGWFAIRRALLACYPFMVMLLASGLGIFWGAWMPFWGFEQIPGIMPFDFWRMLILAASSVPVLMLSYWLQNRLTPTPFKPHRIEVGLLVGLLLLMFFFIAVPLYPVALVVLPMLLLPVVLGLRMHRHKYLQEESYIDTLSGSVPILNYLSLLLMIPAVIFTFAFVSFLELTPWPQYLIYALTVPAGFLVLFASLLGVWYRSREPKLVEAPA